MSIVERRGNSHEHVLELGIVVIGHFSLKLKVAILVAIPGWRSVFFDVSITKSRKNMENLKMEKSSGQWFGRVNLGCVPSQCMFPGKLTADSRLSHQSNPNWPERLGS